MFPFCFMVFFFVLEIINEHDMLLHQETLPSAVIQARQLLRLTVFILCMYGVFLLKHESKALS